MTPKEIVDEVRRRNDEGRGCSAFSEHECAHIDHLLAIHAAVVEYLDAREAFDIAMSNALDFEESDGHNCDEPQDRMLAARAKLADLCGWKVEGA